MESAVFGFISLVIWTFTVFNTYPYFLVFAIWWSCPRQSASSPPWYNERAVEKAKPCLFSQGNPWRKLYHKKCYCLLHQQYRAPGVFELKRKVRAVFEQIGQAPRESLSQRKTAETMCDRYRYGYTNKAVPSQWGRRSIFHFPYSFSSSTIKSDKSLIFPTELAQESA